jgi:putative membrane protein
MMFSWGDQMSGWGWALMTISTIAFWALVIAGIVALVRYTRTAGAERGPEPPARVTPERILAERYARGEIDESEYKRRLDTLDVTGVDGRSSSRR